MKKNVWVRILTGAAGVLLVLMCLCILAETFFHVPLVAMLQMLLDARTPLSVLALLLLGILLGALGVGCVMSLIPEKKQKTRGYVMQKGETGAIGVSVRSIEGLVQTCVRQCAEVHSAEVAIVERRDGIVILLNIEETAGVNIPLSVGALQKQIKQYVSNCTGVDVQEVRVLVENREDDGEVSPYTVQEAVLTAAAVEAAPEAAASEPAAIPEESADAQLAEEAPAEAPKPVAAPVAMPVMPDMPQEADARPLHQRLFGTEEQPAFVPAPPELTVPAAEEAEEPVAEEADAVEEAAQEQPIPLAETTDENAVAEVAQAVSLDDVTLYEADDPDSDE